MLTGYFTRLRDGPSIMSEPGPDGAPACIFLHFSHEWPIGCAALGLQNDTRCQGGGGGGEKRSRKAIAVINFIAECNNHCTIDYN